MQLNYEFIKYVHLCMLRYNSCLRVWYCFGFVDLNIRYYTCCRKGLPRSISNSSTVSSVLRLKRLSCEHVFANILMSKWFSDFFHRYFEQ